ncbi:MAG TPA: hypothetical protein VKB76_03255 [Ktedonobacterales bacterium]|nr:hypothetical protein [Ktedonobacterales bacterium]
MSFSASGQNGISVVGRQSGSVVGYHYSSAMTSAHVTWNDASLDSFLSHPQGVVRDTKMFAIVADARQRLDIIAYLDTLK